MDGDFGRSSNLKRRRGDDDPDQPPVDRRPRFPKGKKVRREEPENCDDDYDVSSIGVWVDPKLAAKERAKRRNQIIEDELFRGQEDISSAEVHYEEDANFEDEGIQIEPFNLNQEKEEGYFDRNGNFVEFVNGDEIKDAWLDNVDVDSKFAEKKLEKIIPEENYQDLSAEDVGKIKRSITDLLQPGETIIQALKRFKGTSSDKRGKMPENMKRMFDQLTEDAMRLMENGEYNVYHEERETFEREAEGYERLVHARDGVVRCENSGNPDVRSRLNTSPEANSSLQVSSDIEEKLDMFGEGDENNEENPQSDVPAMCSSSTSEQLCQPAMEKLDSSHGIGSGEAVGGGLESDYVYDQSTGYYYSNSLGYYYDPTSGLYCCATSGTWYAFDESNGTYTEIHNVAPTEQCVQGSSVS